jgi:hypothetical protein
MFGDVRSGDSYAVVLLLQLIAARRQGIDD